MTITEDKTSVNMDPFWPGLFTKALLVATLGASSATSGLADLLQQQVLLQLRRTKWKHGKKSLRRAQRNSIAVKFLALNAPRIPYGCRF